MLSAVQSRSTLCDPMDCGSPGSLVHHQFPELTQIHVHRVSDAIPPSHPLLSPSLPVFNLSQHQESIVFSNESALDIRWPKYWSFSFNISPTNEYPGLISFRMDWLDLLVVQGTLKGSSPVPHFKSINSLALSFIVQLSHPYVTTGKPIALTSIPLLAK